MTIITQKANEIKQEFLNGLARQEVLEGTYEPVKVYKCTIKAGEKWEPELYAFEDRVQFFFFTNGKGYIDMPKEAYNITEQAVFIPDYDKDNFYLNASTEGDLEFLQFVCKMSEFDIERMTWIRTSTPRFKLLSDCDRYEEKFKGEGVLSYNILQHRMFGKFSMGAVIGKGPAKNGVHVHHDLEQWYYMLPGSKITYFAGDDKVELSEGDINFTPHSIPHGNECEPGQRFDYFWFELCEDGYNGN